jgi:uncharacterized protein (TIGR00730 family)
MNLCVFCGSSSGSNPIYAKAARDLGQLISKSNSTLVYGGGNIGLMGILADEVLKTSGKVIGVIPDFLVKREVGHQGLTQLEIVSSMHERKKRMADLSDAFIAMPGGWGTLDELAEILTWKQLHLIQTQVGLLNINSFFDPLIEQMNTMVNEGFLQDSNLKELIVAKNPSSLLTSLGVVLV